MAADCGIGVVAVGVAHWALCTPPSDDRRTTRHDESRRPHW
ncbi:hypothetical protein RISK_001096 [Rhodopirellula islandica]|uniref:Uncharacterized protein n=1 Tax=Rhodopirellula islandica TaxID=595434 RepID=A0A0J1BJT9_RHOIS|nr:hypothetical protein RISK_001096 [Rhodopirellula islandica]